MVNSSWAPEPHDNVASCHELVLIFILSRKKKVNVKKKKKLNGRTGKI